MTSPVAMANTKHGISLEMAPNLLQGTSFGQTAKRDHRAETEKLDIDMVVKSIGYTSTPLDEAVNFDHERGVIHNDYGCVQRKGHPGQVEVGKYAVGWVKTGAKGIIDTTFKNAEETVNNIRVHVMRDLVKPSSVTTETIKEYLSDRGAEPISYSQWKKIDHHEKAEGKRMGKIRNKVDEIDQMLSIARH